MATSFMSEHTAEFILVPRLSQSLSQHWSVIPLYFWRSREGSNIALECDYGQILKLLAMYARRPKINNPGDDSITVKVNDSLFKRAKYLNEYGIPTIFGIPRISSLFYFKLDCPCSWFIIVPPSSNFCNVEFRLDISNNVVLGQLPKELSGPLSKKEIYEMIQHKARNMTFSEAIYILKEREYGSNYAANSFPWFGPNDKPVYFLLHERSN